MERDSKIHMPIFAGGAAGAEGGTVRAQGVLSRVGQEQQTAGIVGSRAAGEGIGRPLSLVFDVCRSVGWGLWRRGRGGSLRAPRR